jgi:hypothetical protein
MKIENNFAEELPLQGKTPGLGRSARRPEGLQKQMKENCDE